MARTPLRALGTKVNRLRTQVGWASSAALLCVYLLLPLLFPIRASAVSTYNAVGQIGQPDFSSGHLNRTAVPRSSGVSGASDAVIDPVRHRLFVSDPGNGRVLVFALDDQNHLTSQAAVSVLGKPGMGAPALPEAPHAANMSSPRALAYDAVRDRLFVADESPAFNRVLVFDTSALSEGMAATYVLGAADFTVDKSASVAPTAATTVNTQGLAYDATASRLFVADAGGHRVLVFDAADLTNGEDAVHVLGQTEFSTANTGSAAEQLRGPRGVAFDTAGNRLFVADTGNNRVVTYDTAIIENGEAATYVLGQPDFNNEAEGLGESAMLQPTEVVYDEAGSWLFVGDNGNNRVLAFDAAVSSLANGKAASHVIGQGDFTSNVGGTSQQALQMSTAGRLGYDAASRYLYIGDHANNRFMVFDTAALATHMPATQVIGQSDDAGTQHFLTNYPNNRHPLPNSFAEAAHVALDVSRHRLFVADRGNARVNIYQLDSQNKLTSDVPTVVLGQESRMFSLGHTNQRGLSDASAVAYDPVANRLFVADGVNNRVVVYDVTAPTNFMDASFVIGQNDFGGNAAGVAANRLNGPGGLVVDAGNRRLFVADSNNHRVLVFGLNSLANGMAANTVLGMGTFDSIGGGLGANMFHTPRHLAYDDAHERLFVADRGNNRVLVFDTSGLANGMDADVVLGQPHFGSSIEGPIAANTLSQPRGLAYDATNDRLFVVDSGRSRVLLFDAARLANGMEASAVLGADSLTTSAPSTSRSQLLIPHGAVFDPLSNQLFVMDAGNSRLVWFDFMTMVSSELPVLLAGTPMEPVTIPAANQRGEVSFSLDSGELPPGLSLTDAGTLSGTPSVGGSYVFTVKASDRNGALGDFFVRHTFTLRVIGLVVGVPTFPQVTPPPETVPGPMKGQTAVLFIDRTDKGRGDPSIEIPEEEPEIVEPVTERRLYWRLLWWLPILIPLAWAIVLYKRRHHHQ